MINAWKQNYKTASILKRNEFGNKIKNLKSIDYFVYAILRGKDPRKCYHSVERFNEVFGKMNFIMKLYPSRLIKIYGQTINTDHLSAAWYNFLVMMKNEESK